MMKHLYVIAKFLALLLCLPLMVGGGAAVIWGMEIGVTVGVFLLGGLVDLLIVKSWVKK